MTDFLFHLWNHTKLGKASLEDVIGIIGHQLRALGHTAIWDPSNEVDASGKNVGEIKFLTGPGKYNVIVEGFTPAVVDIMRNAHAAGARFLCIATEEPTERGFNHGTQKEMVWRQEIFPSAAAYLDGIVHLVPGQRVTDWYGQHAPTAYVELGYAPSFIRRPVVREPAFDFAFFGSMSPRRLRILKKLANRTGKAKAVRLVGDFPSQVKRDAIIQEARVVLQLRKFDEMGLVSSSRCNTALSCGRPVVAEAHDLALSHPWDQIVKFTATEEEFLTTAMMMRGMWREIWFNQFTKFKEILPPEVCVGEPLRRIGILPPLARRAAA